MKKEVKIGMFAVAMILCAWGGIRFLSGVDIFSRNVDYYAVYDQVNGVQGASPVMMRGVKVGTVSEILFDPARSARVVLRLTVRRQYPIPADSEAKIVSSSLMGSKAIEIVLGGSSEPLEKGDTIRSGYSRDMMDTALTELDFFKEKISRLTEELSRTLTGVSTLVEDNASNIGGLTAHLNSIAGNLDEILSAEKSGLRSAIDGLSEFSQTLGGNAGRVDTLMGNLTRFSDNLAEADLKAGIDRLNGILDRIEGGEGTVGRLMNDAELYENLQQASENLSVLLADLKENPKRYVHFSLFGRSEAREKERAEERAARAEAKRLKDSLKRVR
ncbi:MlaD family protein [uncultured Alistipes sp.]|uniref:MlaD family protein n=1 Tax=uncultured Alistipes sp. TaxID=538949 RepID=UPI0025F1453E|nr:MlaD family protein [uncultured Alistipes sp.]